MKLSKRHKQPENLSSGNWISMLLVRGWELMRKRGQRLNKWRLMRKIALLRTFTLILGMRISLKRRQSLFKFRKSIKRSQERSKEPRKSRLMIRSMLRQRKTNMTFLIAMKWSLLKKIKMSKKLKRLPLSWNRRWRISRKGSKRRKFRVKRFKKKSPKKKKRLKRSSCLSPEKVEICKCNSLRRSFLIWLQENSIIRNHLSPNRVLMEREMLVIHKILFGWEIQPPNYSKMVIITLPSIHIQMLIPKTMILLSVLLTEPYAIYIFSISKDVLMIAIES